MKYFRSINHKAAIFSLSIFILSLVSCTSNKAPYDAPGVFEAKDIIVSSEVSGRILELNIEEGMSLQKAEVIGLIDTTQLHLKLLQLKASQQALLANKPDVAVQLAGLEQELRKAKKEQGRLQKLFEGEAATQKQIDDIEAQIAILESKRAALKSSLNSSVGSIEAQYESLQSQILQVRDQLERAQISSPIDGVVLVQYAEEGEITGTGKPLFKIADLSQMTLKAYLSGDQLGSVQIGQKVTVLAEFGEDEKRSFSASVQWISEVAEFTPKTVQTQDERANLVYAVKLAVPNDGTLKIGMYGGFNLSE